jgi:hypothetical protein
MVQPSSSTWPRILTVNHRILISRLNSLGFSNDCLAWFTNYFSDRVQCVKSEGLLSRGLVVQTSGSLNGGATGFNSRTDSFLCIYQWCRSCCGWFSDPALHRRHHSVYIWPFFGHCPNVSPNHWLQVIYKSLLCKALSYLSSLVTIATPTRSTRSSRYISLVIKKATTYFGRLSFQFSAANDWNELQKSLKLETYISITNFNLLWLQSPYWDKCHQQPLNSIALHTIHFTTLLQKIKGTLK